MSPLGLKFSQMILHTETSKLMYNLSVLFEVLHKPTLLPSTFKSISQSRFFSPKGFNLGRVDCTLKVLIKHIFVEIHSMQLGYILCGKKRGGGVA